MFFMYIVDLFGILLDFFQLWNYKSFTNRFNYLMNRFNSLVYVHYFDAQNSKKMHYKTIWNTSNIAKHFEKLTSENELNINI